MSPSRISYWSGGVICQRHTPEIFSGLINLVLNCK